MSGQQKEISRRKFIVTGSAAVGACSLAAGLTAGSLIRPSRVEAASTLVFQLPDCGLDVEKVREYGYCEYFQSGCGHGGGAALVRGIKDGFDSMGTETSWHQLPYAMFGYANGGGVGWGAMCGSIASILAVMGLVTDGEGKTAGLHAKLGNELVQWYTAQNFPLANLESFIPDQTVYTKSVQTPIADVEVAGHSVPQSPLCHNSVSRWLKAADATLASVDDQGRNLKKDRCSKVTGDSAAYAARLINEFMAGLMPTVWVPEEGYAGCYECHSTEKDMAGKMNCVYCHTNEAAIVGPKHDRYSGNGRKK